MCQSPSLSPPPPPPPSKNNDADELWIFDGGTGREIERRGGPFRQPEWSALSLYENPRIVQDIHESFIKAGATAITTNTYAIVPFHLGHERYKKDSKWLLELATNLAVQAAARGDPSRSDVQVMGCIPPISGSYQPGSFDETIAGPILQDFLTAFRGKVDSIILETMGSAQEAKFALEQIDQSGINVPVYLSFYVQTDENSIHGGKPRLLTGDTLTEAVEFLQQSNLLSVEKVPLIMVNCCDIYLVNEALEELSLVLANIVKSNKKKFRIGAYPNAFSSPPTAAANVKARQVNKDISPKLLQSMAQKWIQDYGASVVGGCCGIGPDHIRAVASLQQLNDDGKEQLKKPRLLPAETSPKTTRWRTRKASTSSCRIRGCGCGVQIGFGQELPLLCGAISGQTN